MGMYRLVPNWWVQSGAGECKGSRPTLPVHHKTVVLHRSYPAAMHGRPYRYTYIPSRPPLVWGYYHQLAGVQLNKVWLRTLHLVSGVLLLFCVHFGVLCILDFHVRCSTPLSRSLCIYPIWLLNHLVMPSSLCSCCRTFRTRLRNSRLI